MTIPFTQYLRPNGRKVPTEIELNQEVEELARKFLQAGGWYESEILRPIVQFSTGMVSLTACYNITDEDGYTEAQDIAIVICENNPEITACCERLIRQSVAWLDTYDNEEIHHG